MGSDHQKQAGSTAIATSPATSAGPLEPGKRSLTESLPAVRAPLQMRAESGPAAAVPADPTTHVHAAAARGTASAATQLPHLDLVQQLFGRHDVSGVKAHVGADAAASAQHMGARAYATGDHVVLGNHADLHTTAHEAAHVVQQRNGVQLKGGVGAVGDAYERNADEVADRVVQGVSAEPLLDAFAPAGAAASRSGGVQMAGHAGVIIFGTHKTEDGVRTILKRVETTEHAEYERVKGLQDSGDAGAKGTFPTVYGVFDAPPAGAALAGNYGASLEGFGPTDDKDTNRFYVEMSSVKVNDGDQIKDFKIGTHTTNAAELERNGHKANAQDAASKVKRENIADRMTESRTLGLRDSDKMRTKKGAPIWAGKKLNVKIPLMGRNTLRSFKNQARNHPYPEGAQVFADLDTIEAHITSSGTVYLASSLILNWSADHSDDHIRLIDLAHPIKSGEDSFDPAKQGMLRGIRNLRLILKGTAPINNPPASEQNVGTSPAQTKTTEPAKHEDERDEEAPPPVEHEGQDAEKAPADDVDAITKG